MSDERHAARVERRRLARRRLLARAAALGLAGGAALLAACQQPTTPERLADARPTPTPPPEPKPTPPLARPLGGGAHAGAAATPGTGTGAGDGQTAPAVGPPKPGGSVIWLAEAEPRDLDPHRAASGVPAHAWADLVYQGLVMFDANQKLVPCLAEAWVNTSPTSWTFTLRQGVRFHDGSELEAADVVVWLERLMAAATAAPDRAWFEPIAKIEPRGRYAVELTLHAPYAPLLATLAAYRGAAIVPRRWAERAGAAARTTAVGSGPFQLVEYVPGSHLRYRKHRAYWEWGLPYLDEVAVRFVADEAAREVALRAGQAAGARLGPAAGQRLRSEKALAVLTSAGPGLLTTVFNCRRRPFDDARVRQAVALALDRRAAVQQALGGLGLPTGPLPPTLREWAPPPESLPYRRDLARARQLLAEAGYQEGFEAVVRAPADDPALLALSQALAELTRALGLTLTVEPLDRAALAGTTAAHDFDVLALRVGFRPDPDGYLWRLYRRASPENVGGWASAHYDALVDEARAVLDPGARRRLYDEAVALLLDEAPAVWWAAEQTVEAVQAGLVGYRPSPSGRWTGLTAAWLAD